jgi:hypothetical protein
VSAAVAVAMEDTSYSEIGEYGIDQRISVSACCGFTTASGTAR